MLNRVQHYLGRYPTAHVAAVAEDTALTWAIVHGGQRSLGLYNFPFEQRYATGARCAFTC